MQVQKGIVKYKDRSDIICTYGLTDDGSQYYFLDGNVASNGNIVATTVLVEAIDPLVGSSSVGLIDPSGNVVIPFENKSIKVINDNILLVEKANSTTPSVVEANKLRSDPLAATKLVTTPATIKEKINNKMGSEGRFIFNDQFSEATIYDVNGNNLVNDEYYSFIAIKNDDILYMSKNVVESPVMEFTVSSGVIVESDIEENDVLGALDVTDTDVNQDEIEEAMSTNENSGFGVDDITAKDFEAINELDNVDVSESSENDSEVVNLFEEQNDEENSVAAIEETEVNDIPDELVLNVGDVAEDVSDGDLGVFSSTDEGLEEVDASVSEVEAEIPIVSADNEEVKEVEEIAVSENTLEEEKNDGDLMDFTFSDNINDSSEEKDIAFNEAVSDTELNSKVDLFGSDIDDDIFAESKLHIDKIINDYDEIDYTVPSNKDTIIEDVASAMSNLINLNRSQKQKIMTYEEKFEEMVSVHKRVVEKARGQVRDIETLKNKIKNYEVMVAKLEAKVQSLENKVYDQERLISSQSSELDTLRPQIEGKKELVKILADAQVLLDQAA